MHILAIDNEPKQLKTLCLNLKSCGFTIETADSAGAALACLDDQHAPVDLVITDYDMPETDGLSFLKSVRQTYIDMPVILISATASEEMLDPSFQNQCTGFIEKPFTMEVLEQEIYRISQYNKKNVKPEFKPIKEEFMEPDTSRDNQDRHHLYDKEGKYLTFVLEKEDYGISITNVREIIGMMGITSVPRCPDFIKGVINLRGKVIPIVDLRTRFGMKAVETTDKTCIIVVEVNKEDSQVIMGLVVDSVSEVLPIKGEDIEETLSFGTQLDTRYILGMAKLEGGVKILLDIDRVLDDGEIDAVSNI